MTLKPIYRDYSFITFVWFFAALIVNPAGEFPLNDSWAYAKNVYQFTEEGIFEMSDWPGMTLIAHWFYGVIISEIFGFSFSILRISSWLLGLLTLFLFHRFVVRYQFPKKIVWITLFILAFNPLFFSLSYTFHTDIPFLLAFLASFFCFHRYGIDQKSSSLICATIFAVIATLIRQLGIGLPLAFICYWLLFLRDDRKVLLWAILSFGLCLATLVIYKNVMENLGQLSARYSSPDLLLDFVTKRTFPILFLRRIGILLFYFGLFLFPLMVLRIPEITKALVKRNAILASVFMLLVVVDLPYVLHGNLIFDFGIGPIEVKEVYLGIHNYPQLSFIPKLFIALIAILGSWIFSYFMIGEIHNFFDFKQSGNSLLAAKRFSIIMMAGYLVFLISESHFFDRYYLVLFPFLLVVLVPTSLVPLKASFMRVAFATLSVISLFSLAATHDYISWNRVRWEGLERLMETGVTIDQIDGGFEFNGWYEPGSGVRNDDPTSDKSWWFVKDDEYLFGLNGYCNYETIDKLTYFSYLQMAYDSVIIDKRTPFFEPLKVTQSHHFDSDIELDIFKMNDFEFQLAGLSGCEQVLVVLTAMQNGNRVFIDLTSPDNKLYRETHKVRLNKDHIGNSATQRVEFRIPKNYPFGKVDVRIRNYAFTPSYISKVSVYVESAN